FSVTSSLMVRKPRLKLDSPTLSPQLVGDQALRNVRSQQSKWEPLVLALPALLADNFVQAALA
nr:hypothetical protein [Caldilineaceae bacterium]